MVKLRRNNTTVKLLFQLGPSQSFQLMLPLLNLKQPGRLKCKALPINFHILNR